MEKPTLIVTHTAEQLQALHDALLSGCGMPKVRLSISFIRQWRDALEVLAPLQDTPEGILRVEDIVRVLGKMHADNAKREEKYRKAVTPYKILMYPEELFDRVLLARKPERKRTPDRPLSMRGGDGTSRRVMQSPGDARPGSAGEEASRQVEAMRAFQARNKPGAR